MLGSGRPRDGNVGWSGGFAGVAWFTAQPLGQVISLVFSLLDCALCFSLRAALWFVRFNSTTMGSRSTNNSLQTAPPFQPASGVEIPDQLSLIPTTADGVVTTNSYQPIFHP